MDLLSALKILKSATAESLKDHHQEVLETLADLESRLHSTPFLDDQFSRDSSITSEAPDQPGDSSVSESESCDSSITSNSSFEVPTSDTSTSTSNSGPSIQCSKWLEMLLATISDDIRWLLKYSTENSTETAIQNQRENGKDKRVADIQGIEGSRNRNPSNEDRIFRAFAQRSMGIEFTQIQRKAKVKKTRVDELCESICSSDCKVRDLLKRRTNFAANHLDHFRYRPVHKSIVLRGINAGVKRLTMEKLFGERLEESNRPVKPEGISVLTALKITAFDRLLYRDIPYFLDQVLSCEVNLSDSPTSDKASTASVKLPDIFIKLSPWVQEFQDKYDENISKDNKSPVTTDDAIHEGQRPPKRLRLSLPDITIPPNPLEDGNMRRNSADAATLSTSSQPEIPSICQGSEDSGTSASRLPVSHPCFLGNWDKDYGFVPMQNTQTPAAHFFWSNCNPREDSFSSLPEQQTVSCSAPWGNWDQDYNDATTSNPQAQPNPMACGPWGNWDQDCDVTLSSGAGWASPSMFYYSR